MPPYRQLGSIPRKRHTMLRREGGFKGEGIYYEEVLTTAGFGRAYSIAYHLRPPTRVRKVEPAGAAALETVEEAVLRHHHLKSGRMPRAGDPVTGRT
jgi:homogentisate 1,2-dioxygenase